MRPSREQYQSRSGQALVVTVKGFTVVELIGVLVIAGILVGVGANRLGDTDPYEELVIAEGLLSQMRVAQQVSFGQDDVKILISSAAEVVSVSVLVGNVAVSERTYSSPDVVVTAGALGPGANCSTIGSTITVPFSAAADIEGNDSDGYPLCLNSQATLCVSPSGFAHTGACE